MAYRNLEQQTSRIISSICRPFCSRCNVVCCKEEFCSESIDSFWLRLIWQTCDHEISQYDAHRGWLRPNGCGLMAGRPPLCHEYFCNDIFDKISQASSSHDFIEISKLLALAGKNALGNSHLVTLSSEQVLTRLNFTKLKTRITRSFEQLRRYEKDLSGPTLLKLA